MKYWQGVYFGELANWQTNAYVKSAKYNGYDVIVTLHVCYGDVALLQEEELSR